MTASRIWKYQLEVTDEQAIEMPSGGIPLTVQVQRDQSCLWALVPEMAGETRLRRIRMVGTGHLFLGAEDWNYLGTFQLHGGGLVFHVFVDEEASA